MNLQIPPKDITGSNSQKDRLKEELSSNMNVNSEDQKGSVFIGKVMLLLFINIRHSIVEYLWFEK